MCLGRLRPKKRAIRDALGSRKQPGKIREMGPPPKVAGAAEAVVGDVGAGAVVAVGAGVVLLALAPRRVDMTLGWLLCPYVLHI